MARSEYYPLVATHLTWQVPQLQPWEELRATETSVTVAWTPGWNPWCTVENYELDSRRPAGDPLRFADIEMLQNRELDPENETWPGDEHWTPWEEAYFGLGRVYTKRIEAGTGYAVQFRVRACGRCGAAYSPSCSSWSDAQTTHTILSAAVDMINFHMRGAGKNAPDYAYIEVNRQVIYKRRDETGLVLAIFSRLDFSLQWLRTYDTHRDRNASLQMSKDLRLFNSSYFVFVVSTIAWEWHAPRSLVKMMEFCGAFHFSQWAYIFAEQEHYYSNESDLQQTASQDEFGHPYAFVGIPGIGTGMGWESLMHNTGHYLARERKSQLAVVRGIAYFDYVARLFRLHDVRASKADWYLKGQPPTWETLHNPVPKRKAEQAAEDEAAGVHLEFTPYTGTLQKHITKLIEANATVPPYNFAFGLVTEAEVRKVDPRPKKFWLTELERVWSGPSARYWPHNGTQLANGTELDDRACRDFIYYGYNEASPEACGPDFATCCPEIDTPEFTAVACNAGVSPTVCRDVESVMMENQSQLLETQRPFPFGVIDL